jgi:hypothetical protein
MGPVYLCIHITTEAIAEIFTDLRYPPWLQLVDDITAVIPKAFTDVAHLPGYNS